jgi:hypothetical protein
MHGGTEDTVNALVAGLRKGGWTKPELAAPNAHSKGVLPPNASVAALLLAIKAGPGLTGTVDGRRLP